MRDNKEILNMNMNKSNHDIRINHADGCPPKIKVNVPHRHSLLNISVRHSIAYSVFPLRRMNEVYLLFPREGFLSFW